MKIKNAKNILGIFTFNRNTVYTYLFIFNTLIFLINANKKLEIVTNGLDEQDPIDDNKLNFITEITSSSIHKFFDNSETMLILFTETNCLKCNRYTKILLELSEKLSKENSDLKKIRMGTVNGFQEKHIVEKNNIEEIPSFLYINKKLNHEEIISDIQSTRDIYDFLHKKIIRKWNLLENLQQANDFREKRINMIVCRSERSDVHEDFFKVLNSIIAKYEDVNYYVLNVVKYKSEIQKLEREYQGN